MTGKLHKINLTEITHTETRYIRRVIKSGMKFLIGRMSHIMSEVTAACSVFILPHGRLVVKRCFGGLEEKVVTTFHCCVLNHPREKHSVRYEAKAFARE